MQFPKLAVLALVAVAAPAAAAPVKNVGGKTAAAMGTCSALTGVAAAACYNTGHTTAGYALTGVSGAAGSAAAFTALHNKKPASSNDVELGSHHSDTASHHSGSSGASFHTAHSHKRSTEEVMEEFE